MKADVDGDDDDDDRGGVSGRPGMRVGEAAEFHACLSRSPLQPSPSVSPEARSHELIRGGYRTPLPRDGRANVMEFKLIRPAR